MNKTGRHTKCVKNLEFALVKSKQQQQPNLCLSSWECVKY